MIFARSALFGMGGGVISRRNDSGPGIPGLGACSGGGSRAAPEAPPSSSCWASATSVALCGGERARYLAKPPATRRSHRSRPSLPGGKTSVPILVSSLAAYSLNRLLAPRTSTCPRDSSSCSACSARPTRRDASPAGAEEGPGCVEPVAPAVAEPCLLPPWSSPRWSWCDAAQCAARRRAALLPPGAARRPKQSRATTEWCDIRASGSRVTLLASPFKKATCKKSASHKRAARWTATTSSGDPWT